MHRRSTPTLSGSRIGPRRPRRRYGAGALFGIVLAVAMAAGAPRPSSAAPAAQPEQSGDESRETTPPGFEWSARPILDGNLRLGAWTGAEVTLSNDGAGRDFEVFIETTGMGTVSRVSVEMPAGARKRLVVPFRPLPHRWQGNAFAYVESDGWRSPRRSLEMNADVNADAVLVISDEDPRLIGLEGLIRRGPSSARFLLAPVEDFPDHPLLLGTVGNVILVGGFSRATEAQRLALERWVRLGGQLTLLGGARGVEAHAGLPESLRPAVVEGVEETSDLTALGGWIGAPLPTVWSGGSVGETATPEPQSEVLGAESGALLRPAQVSRLRPVDGATVVLATRGGAVGGAELPLIVNMLVGDGVVVALAVDPGAPPLRGWESDQQMWSKLRSERQGGVLQEVERELTIPEQMEHISSRANQSRLPSPAALILVLASYVAIVGPFNYLVLKRKGRLDLAWLTIPALTLTFTALSYGVGYRVHGGRLVASQSAIIRVPAGGGVAYVRGWFDIRSPSDRSYDVDLDGAWAHASNSSSSPYTMVFDGDGAVEDLHVEQWSQQGFAYEAIIEWPLVAEGSTSSLELLEARSVSGTTAEGGVVSPFVADVEDARLIRGLQSMSLGNVRGAGALEVSGRLEALPNSRSFAGADEGRRQLAAAFYTGSDVSGLINMDYGYQDGYYDYYSGGVPANMDGPNVQPSSGRFPVQHVFLAGWSDEPPVRLAISGRRADEGRTALWLSRVPTEGEVRGVLGAPADSGSIEMEDDETEDLDSGVEE